MNISDVHHLYVIPALTLLPERMHSVDAMAMMHAIALQESPNRDRKQIGGPAHGFWQFEVIGVQGVLEGRSTEGVCRGVLERLNYPYNADAVYQAIRYDGILAAVLSRLYLYQYPGVLPGRDIEEGWTQYVGTWRPGKPHPDRWPANFVAAWRFIDGA